MCTQCHEAGNLAPTQKSGTYANVIPLSKAFLNVSGDAKVHVLKGEH